MTEAKKQCGIYVDTNTTHISSNVDNNRNTSDVSYDEDCDDDDKVDGNLNSDCDNNETGDNYTYEDEHFTVEITRDVWNKSKNLEPLVYKGRTYIRFKLKVWTNKVSLAFFKQRHLKCAFDNERVL